MENAGKESAEQNDNLRRHYEDAESRRQFLLLYLFNVISGFFLFSFGIAAFYSARYVLAAIIIFFSIVAAVNIFLLKYKGDQTFAKASFVFGALIMLAYAIVSGGVNHTGPLWCYPGVAATFFILGVRRGLPMALCISLMSIVAFYVPLPGIEVADYSNDFKLRFILSFFTLMVFAGLHEFARAKNQGELYRVSSKLDQLSKIDQLTALPNRRHMIDRLELENSRYVRHGRPYSIVYADIDNFKQVNDRYGHDMGDTVLRTLAKTMRAVLRQHDEVCRWGGEEFLIMLPETDRNIAGSVAEKLRAAVAAVPFGYGDSILRMTMSFGVHTVEREDKIEALIDLADKKLYVAKNTGKNRVVTELPA